MTQTPQGWSIQVFAGSSDLSNSALLLDIAPGLVYFNPLWQFLIPTFLQLKIYQGNTPDKVSAGK